MQPDQKRYQIYISFGIFLAEFNGNFFQDFSVIFYKPFMMNEIFILRRCNIEILAQIVS